MPRGFPDWWRIKGPGGTMPIPDMAELAARLLSPVVYDRRGDVIFIETFDGGYPSWTCEEDGDGGLCQVALGGAHVPGYVAQTVTAAVTNAEQRLSTNVPVVPAGALGLEMSWAVSNVNAEIRFECDWIMDGIKTQVGLKYDPSLPQLYYWDATPAWVALDDPLILVGTLRFTTWKVVWDHSTKKYKRVLFGWNEYDMSTIDTYQETTTASNRLAVTLAVLSKTGLVITASWDDLIITQNEP